MCGCWFQKVGPKEGSIEPSSWGRKVIRRWERREDYQAQESHLKRKGYQLTSQNSGPKAKTQSYQIPHWISTWTNEEQLVFQSGANRSRELDNLKCTKWHYEEQASEELHNCKLYIWSLQALLILEAYEDSITVGQSCLPCSLYALCIHQFCRDGWRDSYCDPQNLMRSGDWREREGERDFGWDLVAMSTKFLVCWKFMHFLYGFGILMEIKLWWTVGWKVVILPLLSSSRGFI